MAIDLTTTADGIDHLPVVETSPAANARKANAALFVRSSASAVRSGVLPGPSTWNLTFGSPTSDTWYVGPGSAVLADGAGGALIVTSGSTKSEAVTRPSSGNSRYDVIALEPVFTGTPGVSLVCYSGTPSASPSLSTAVSQMSADAVKIGSYRIGNSGAPTITMDPQFAALGGAPVHVRDATDRTTLDASGALFPGIRIFRLDLGLEQVNPTGVAEATTAGSWVTVRTNGVAAICARPVTTPAQSIPTSTNTLVALAGTPDYAYAGITIASSVITVADAGVYVVGGVVQFYNGLGTARAFARVETFTNESVGAGKTIAADDLNSAGVPTLKASHEGIYLAAGTKLRMYAWQNSGSGSPIAPVDGTNGGPGTSLTVRRVA